jgi:CHAT domain
VSDVLDLAILDSGNPARATVMARSGPDLALAQIQCEPALSKLSAFRQTIDRALLGLEKRPERKALTQFGEQLFSFAVSGDVARLYGRLPNSHVRLHLVSNSPDLQSLPWEYLQDPNQVPGPNVMRSVVRVVPAVGLDPPTPLKLSSRKVKILFASADPSDQDLVSWPEVKASVERVFAARLPDSFELEAIEATGRGTLLDAIQRSEFDIFHFSGHGTVRSGAGQIVLTDRRGRSVFLGGDELGTALRGRNIKLAVLSACDTASGDFSNNFALTAEALVRAGIPAVVANQLPIPDASVAVFTGAMYDKLLRSGDIDQSVGEGRVRLAIELAAGQDAVLEWGIPTLYRHLAGAEIFEP